MQTTVLVRSFEDGDLEKPGPGIGIVAGDVMYQHAVIQPLAKIRCHSPCHILFDVPPAERAVKSAINSGPGGTVKSVVDVPCWNLDEWNEAKSDPNWESSRAKVAAARIPFERGLSFATIQGPSGGFVHVYIPYISMDMQPSRAIIFARGDELLTAFHNLQRNRS